MSSEDAPLIGLRKAVEAIGRGFDVTSDTRLLYCKGSRLISLDESTTRDVTIPGVLHLPSVPLNVSVSQENRGRHTTPALSFLKMAEYFNQRCGLSGSSRPLGCFNSMFNFTAPSEVDAASTKSLAMDGYFIPLFKVHLVRNSDFPIRPEVANSVPHTWDAEALASFIENFGTHVVTSVTIGGQDVVYVKQHTSSGLSELEIERYIRDIGNHRFSDPEAGLSKSNFRNTPEHPHPHPVVPSLSGKEDITVIFRRRGGDDLVPNLNKWVGTVNSSPDVVNMTFLPISSLLSGLPGSKHLLRAIELYLEYKPSVEELRCFLDFQIQRVWSPEDNNTTGGHLRKEPVCPSLQFSLMGPKLFISPEQVTVGRRPVTGLRLSLEGSKDNRLAIHLQHLSVLPKILQPHWGSHVAIGAPKWQGPEEQDSRWFEPIKWKNFAHVSTAPIEYTEANIGDLSGVHVVTGAQLGIWDFGSKSVLYLKLLFSKVPGCTIRRSVWDHSPSNSSRPSQDDVSSSLTEKRNLDDKKAELNHTGKLAKIIDTTEMWKGPQDMPGHWLVTGAKLGIEKGKIVVRVKYSLLNY